MYVIFIYRGVFLNCIGREVEASHHVNLNHHRLCSLHFSSDSFLTPKRDKLTRRAVPIDHRTAESHSEMQVFDRGQVFRTYSKIPQVLLPEAVPDWHYPYRSPRAESPIACDEEPDNDETVRLRLDNERLRSVIRKLELQMRQSAANAPDSQQSQAEAASESVDLRNPPPSTFIDISGVKSEVSRTMIEMQLRPDNVKTPYPENERDLAMRMHYYSASAYEKLREMGLKLPAERTVRRWVAETEVNVGFCDHVFAGLKQAMLEIPAEERCCALKWDEMSLMEREEYDVKTDVIEGFEDLGPLGRTERRANHVFVFCLNGLHPCNQWRTMLAYFLPCNNVSGPDIVRLLRLCILKINDAGADLKMTVCDQGTSNGKAYSELGVREDQPYFFHEDKRIIALYDFPHAVKNVLGMLRKWGKITAAEKTAVHSDFTNTFRSDLGCETSNLLGHITEAHMWPNAFERMNVSRAFQVFSKRFASAMELAHHSEAVKSDTIADTAKFCRSMDKIIDACNSASMFNANPARRPLCVENPEVEEILVDFLSWAPDMKVCAKGRWKRPASFVGIVQTVRGILSLYRQLRELHPGFKLCTALCNQDSVEQLFSRFRGRGGFNPNPTCRMFRLTARHLISVRNIISSKRGNVVCDDLPYLAVASGNEEPHITGDLTDQQYEASASAVEFFEDGEFAPFNDADNNDLIDAPSETESDSDVEDNDDLDLATRVRLLRKAAVSINTGSYEANAIAFFAGYTVNKLLKVHPCDRCRDTMAKKVSDSTNANERYTECREYVSDDTYIVTSLKRPTDRYHKIVETQLQSFLTVYIRRKHKDGILKQLVAHAIGETNKIDQQWFDESDPCNSHRIFAVRFMLRVKLQRHCQLDNRAARSKNLEKRRAAAAKRNASKPARKMRNILHT